MQALKALKIIIFSILISINIKISNLVLRPITKLELKSTKSEQAPIANSLIPSLNKY